MGTVLLFEQNRKLGEQTEVLRVQTERLAEQTGFMQAQTELMEAQTERLREQTEAAAMQNEIMSLNLVNEIRGQLLASVEKRTLGAWLSERGVVGINEPLVQFVSQTERCQLFLDLDYQLSGRAKSGCNRGPYSVGAECRAWRTGRKCLETVGARQSR